LWVSVFKVLFLNFTKPLPRCWLNSCSAACCTALSRLRVSNKADCSWLERARSACSITIRSHCCQNVVNTRKAKLRVISRQCFRCSRICCSVSISVIGCSRVRVSLPVLFEENCPKFLSVIVIFNPVGLSPTGLLPLSPQYAALRHSSSFPVPISDAAGAASSAYAKQPVMSLLVELRFSRFAEAANSEQFSLQDVKRHHFLIELRVTSTQQHRTRKTQ